MADSSDTNVNENSESGVPIELSQNLPEFADWLPEFALPYWEMIAQYPIIGAIVIASVFEGLKKPVFNVVCLFGLTLAVRAASLPVGTDFVVKVLLSLIIAILIRALFFLSSELLGALARNHHRFTAIEERTMPLLDIIAKLLIMLIGSYSLLLVWGINPIGWLASAGIVGLAVGFAAQDTLANLFAGFFILIDSPYKLGDYVNLDSGERGMITHIGMRSTRMLTRDDVEITVPNSVMGNAKIINESGGPHEKMRLRIAVGVAYGSDIHEVESLLESIAASVIQAWTLSCWVGLSRRSTVAA